MIGFGYGLVMIWFPVGTCRGTCLGGGGVSRQVFPRLLGNAWGYEVEI